MSPQSPPCSRRLERAARTLICGVAGGARGAAAIDHYVVMPRPTTYHLLAALTGFPMGQLVERSRRTGHLAVRVGRGVIYIREKQAKRQSVLARSPGARLPAHLASSGQVMLAAMSTGQLAAFYLGLESFPLQTTWGIQSLGALNVLLRSIRERGFSREQGEVTNGYSSLVIPLSDRSSEATADSFTWLPLSALRILPVSAPVPR